MYAHFMVEVILNADFPLLIAGDECYRNIAGSLCVICETVLRSSVLSLLLYRVHS